ncbi:MAG TPA: YqgE/AlgH family protein, partial [Opitutales bacterium]|nr:YqgE/AlgH family protein [Opitutales bacterium]
GEVLIAHPGLSDPQFKESVVFVSGHHPQVGSVGFIINRPLGKTLSQLHSSYTYSPLARVPVYQGGPVMTGEVFFVAWQWFEAQGRFSCQVAICET